MMKPKEQKGKGMRDMWLGKYKREGRDGVIAKGMDGNGMEGTGGTGEKGAQLFKGRGEGDLSVTGEEGDSTLP